MNNEPNDLITSKLRFKLPNERDDSTGLDNKLVSMRKKKHQRTSVTPHYPFPLKKDDMKTFIKKALEACKTDIDKYQWLTSILLDENTYTALNTHTSALGLGNTHTMNTLIKQRDDIKQRLISENHPLFTTLAKTELTILWNDLRLQYNILLKKNRSIKSNPITKHLTTIKMNALDTLIQHTEQALHTLIQHTAQARQQLTDEEYHQYIFQPIQRIKTIANDTLVKNCYPSWMEQTERLVDIERSSKTVKLLTSILDMYNRLATKYINYVKEKEINRLEQYFANLKSLDTSLDSHFKKISPFAKRQSQVDYNNLLRHHSLSNPSTPFAVWIKPALLQSILKHIEELNNKSEMINFLESTIKKNTEMEKSDDRPLIMIEHLYSAIRKEAGMNKPSHVISEILHTHRISPDEDEKTRTVKAIEEKIDSLTKESTIETAFDQMYSALPSISRNDTASIELFNKSFSANCKQPDNLATILDNIQRTDDMTTKEIKLTAIATILKKLNSMKEDREKYQYLTDIQLNNSMHQLLSQPQSYFSFGLQTTSMNLIQEERKKLRFALQKPTENNDFTTIIKNHLYILINDCKLQIKKLHVDSTKMEPTLFSEQITMLQDLMKLSSIALSAADESIKELSTAVKNLEKKILTLLTSTPKEMGAIGLTRQFLLNVCHITMTLSMQCDNESQQKPSSTLFQQKSNIYPSTSKNNNGMQIHEVDKTESRNNFIQGSILNYNDAL